MNFSDAIDAANMVLSARADRRPDYAIVYRIDASRVDIVTGASRTVIRNCIVKGDVRSLHIGQTVPIKWWRGGRPYVQL